MVAIAKVSIEIWAKMNDDTVNFLRTGNSLELMAISSNIWKRSRSLSLAYPVGFLKISFLRSLAPPENKKFSCKLSKASYPRSLNTHVSETSPSAHASKCNVFSSSWMDGS